MTDENQRKIDREKELAEELGIKFSGPMPVPEENIDWAESDRAQPRSASGKLFLDPDNMERLLAVDDPKELPPIWVSHGRASSLKIRSGRHRGERARIKREGVVYSYVIDQDTPEKLLVTFSVRANVHGLPTKLSTTAEIAANHVMIGTFKSQTEAAESLGVAQAQISQALAKARAHEILLNAGLSEARVGSMSIVARQSAAKLVAYDEDASKKLLSRFAKPKATNTDITTAVEKVMGGAPVDQVVKALDEKLSGASPKGGADSGEGPTTAKSARVKKVNEAHASLAKDSSVLMTVKHARKSVDRINIDRMVGHLATLEEAGHMATRQQQIRAIYETVAQSQAIATRLTSFAVRLSEGSQ